MAKKSLPDMTGSSVIDAAGTTDTRTEGNFSKNVILSLFLVNGYNM